MKVSYQWLSEYIDLNGLSADELAEKLTHSGIEIDRVEKRNQGVSGVVVGEVLACEQHPNADKLSLCRVDAGTGETLQIICGAPNVAAGQKVPVAMIGAVLPGNFKIKKAKLRGVESQGMICSAKELGMNDRLLPKDIQEGILVLPPDTPVGEDAVAVLGLDDEVLELDLTPNRSDCLSMIGTAYEVAAIQGTLVRLPQPEQELQESEERADQQISVRIDAPEGCRHYAARYIRNVQVGPSPQWMQNRLVAAGVRPINNVVDVTNYVMLEYGQPLHAFDAARLEEKSIIVRTARDGEKLVTLDDEERTLDSSTLVIADAVKPVAIAGVMGGADTQVTEGTTDILLESANFHGVSVRITSRKLGLRSESSLRFEKEADPAAVVPALNRAAELIARIAGGNVAEGFVEDVRRRPEERHITLGTQRVNEYLGTALSELDLEQTFDRLQFAWKKGSGAGEFIVSIPTRRGDIERDVDLIEEVARLYGYDQIPTTLPSGTTTVGHLNPDQSVRRAVRNWLLGQGVHEAITYSFTDPAHIEQFAGMYEQTRPVRLSMPMSEERSVLRTSLVPGLLEAARYNRNRNEEDVALFEIGHVFLSDQEIVDRQPEEKRMLAVLWCGKSDGDHWSGSGTPVDFYDLKGLLDSMFDYLGVEGARYRPAQPAGFHPGRTAVIELETDEGPITLGRIGQIHPDLQRQYDLDETYVLEIEFAPVADRATRAIRYRPLPKYPAVGRDIAVVVAEETPVGDMLTNIRQTAGPLLEKVNVFDIYRGDAIGNGRKSVAFSLTYRHEDRTLTDEEVNERQQAIVTSLAQAFSAELRQQ